MSHEFPTADPEMWLEIMAKPLRYRQLTIWDWQLPKDDSLEIYRQNLKALKAKNPQPCRYGHTSGRYRNAARPGGWGDCIECRRISDAAEYRADHGIPLDAPLMTAAQAGRLGGLARGTCPHGPDTERTKWGHCVECRRSTDRERKRKERAA